MKFKHLSSIGIFLVSLSASFNGQAFIVQSIQIQGLQNLLSSTVRQYIHVHEGEDLTPTQSNQVLQDLYQTGFFDSVNLLRRQNTLIVEVVERPMITLIKVEGNKEISLSKIQPVMKKIGLVAGEIYDPLKLQSFTQSLEQQYAMMGYGATSVTSTVTPVSHNRVSVLVKVSEGKIVKVHGIHITGNHAFSESKLKSQFKLTTPGIFTIFTHSDRYSEVQLNKDLQHLTNFYLDHGYARFHVVSHHEVYSADRKHVDIDIQVAEGPIYTISGYKITGQTLKYGDELQKLVTLKQGSVFSRQQVINAEKAINNFYADKAYAFVQVNVVPTIDDINHTVFLTFNIVSGKRVYVRRIEFKGNSVTNQEVLRREMRQMEAAPYSLSNVNESKRRLMLTSYFSKVDVKSQPVEGTNNQVDLDVNVKERTAGKASVQGGWSSAYGFLYGANITQPNFLGSGKYVSLGFNNSQVFQNYFFNYVNPYYKWWGLSRGFSVFYNVSKPTQSLNFTPYTLDSFGGDLVYGFPISENNLLSVDFNYTRYNLYNVFNNGFLAPSVINFLNPNPVTEGPGINIHRHYEVTKITTSWTYQGLDRAIMPTHGVQNGASFELGVPIFGDNLSYFILSDKITAYVPVTRGFILNFLGQVGYGKPYGDTNPYPFFLNFFAGGIGSVPGYQANSLGPKYNPNGNAYNCVQGAACGFPSAALGGNLLTTAGVHLILPNFISNQVRIALTFDAGNVFQSPVYGPDTTALIPNTKNPLVVQDDPFALKNFRTSAGVLVTWNAPFFGPIDLSVAFPLNKQAGDQSEIFQFAMGLSF